MLAPIDRRVIAPIVAWDVFVIVRIESAKVIQIFMVFPHLFSSSESYGSE